MTRALLGTTIGAFGLCGSAGAATAGDRPAINFVPATVTAAVTPTAVYVDRSSIGGSCSDSRSAAENTVGTPWCSINRAFKAAPSGSTVYIRAAQYPLVNVGAFAPVSTVTFAPYPGETPLIKGMSVGVAAATSRNFVITGLKFTNPGISLTNLTDVRLTRNEIALIPQPPGPCGATSCVSHTPEAILLTPPASNLAIDENYIHDGSMGVAMHLGTPPRSPGHPLTSTFQNIAIDGNTFSRMGDVVINVQNFEGVDISHNTFANDYVRNDVDPKCHCDAVHAIGGGDRLMLDGNLAYGGRGFLIQPSYSTGRNCTPACLTMTNTVVQNNVFVGHDFGIRVLSAPGIKILNNTIEGPAGPDLGLSLLRGVPATTDAVVANNLISHFESASNVTFATADYNDVLQRTIGPGWATPTGPHDITGTPSYTDPSAPGWNFGLTAQSPGVNAGSSAYAPSTGVSARESGDPVNMGTLVPGHAARSTAAIASAVPASVGLARVSTVTSRGRVTMRASAGSVTVTTGLAVSCPLPRRCRVSVSVAASAPPRGIAAGHHRAAARLLSAAVRRSVPAGTTRLLELRLSRRAFTRLVTGRGAAMLSVRLALIASPGPPSSRTLRLHLRAL